MHRVLTNESVNKRADKCGGACEAGRASRLTLEQIPWVASTLGVCKRAACHVPISIASKPGVCQGCLTSHERLSGTLTPKAAHKFTLTENLLCRRQSHTTELADMRQPLNRDRLSEAV